MMSLQSESLISIFSRFFEVGKTGTVIGRWSKVAFFTFSLFLPLAFGFSSTFDASGADVESTECELTTSRTLTVIKSVRFPEAYGPNVDCRYAVRRRGPSVCSVTFLFNVLDLEPSPNCQKAYLKFHDTGEKLCGSKPVGFSRTVSFKKLPENGEEILKDTDNQEMEEVVMSFHSDNGTKGGLGYMVTVVQQECPKASCDAVHSETDFSITSPNYPLPYDNGRTCTYVIHKSHPAVCKLSLTVRQFDVEEDEHCEADFLRFGSDGQRLCGALAPGQIVELNFSNDTITLEFQSDHVTTRDGFRIDVHQNECPPSTTSASLSTHQEQHTESHTTTSQTLQTNENKVEDNSTLMSVTDKGV